jgi:GNAT superfamily N-acetyltransferase
VHVRTLVPGDRDDWSILWNGYLVFYDHQLPGEVTEVTWQRLVGGDDSMLGLCAVQDRSVQDRSDEDGSDGDLVGICHLVFHPSTWSASTYCYLEDLFVDPGRRSIGAGRALIEAAAEAARGAGSSSLYWQTHETNATARRLYDRVARHRGFLVYEMDLAAGSNTSQEDRP